MIDDREDRFGASWQRMVLEQRLRDPAQLSALLTEVPGARWQELQARALSLALQRAATAPAYRDLGLDPRRIDADPFAAVLAFAPLRKADYWDRGSTLRLTDVAVDHVFYTSGTEGGVPTEQPWDRWSFDKSFGEASALALLAVGARAGDRVLLGAPSHGALGLAFTHACALLGLQVHHDALAFSDPASFAGSVEFARAGVDLLVAAPGSLLALALGLREAGLDPRALGVRGVITGIGTFSTARHVDQIVEAFAPEFIHEQGGKNEILHAVGGRRYSAAQPQAVSAPGFLHVLPWAAHVVAVDAEALEQGERVPVGHDQPGVLLMTRLSAGGRGCVAYVNDAGDFGETRGYGGVDAPISACGNTMPAFRFLGRVGQAVSNKIGDTLFTEELVRALDLAAADLQLEPALAAALRVQVLLVHDDDPRRPDSLYWIIGAPARAATTPGVASLQRLAARWLARWPRVERYRGSLAGVMTLAGHAVVDVAALPHAGRDKPRYPLALARTAAPGQAHAAVFEDHLARGLQARILCRSPA